MLGIREVSEKEQLNDMQQDLAFFIHPSVQGKKLSLRAHTVFRKGISPENFRKEASTCFSYYKVKLKNVRNFYCNAAIFLFVPVAPLMSCLAYITPYHPEVRDLTLTLVLCSYPEVMKCSGKKLKEFLLYLHSILINGIILIHAIYQLLPQVNDTHLTALCHATMSSKLT